MSKVKFKIIDGGKAIPIGNNLYKLEGRSHEEGGIGIELRDGNAKTIIEAEDGEDFEPKAHEFRIFSNSVKIGNKTPAQLAEAGYNPDIIFKVQQNINGNYGGSYAQKGTNQNIKYNFSGIKTTGNRAYKPEYISRAHKYLIEHGVVDKNTIATILANIIEESGGDPLIRATDGSTSKGLLQWTDDRYVLKENITFGKAFDEQMKFIVDNLNAENSRKKGNNNEWAHGGKGSGFNSYKEANAHFNDSTSLNDKMKGYTLGYVRPAGKEQSVNNRIIVAEQILNILNNGSSKLKNGGQINMKLKHKNKQDITDMVMNEILPSYSTGERKKFFTGGFWGNLAANGVNSLLQGIISPILNYKMADEIEKSGKDLQPAQMSKNYLDSRDYTREQQLGLIDSEINKLAEVSSKNTNNSKTHINRMRQYSLEGIRQKNKVYGESFAREQAIKNENARMSQEVDKFNITNKNQFTLINEQNRLARQAAAMNARMAGNAAITQSIGSLLKGVGTAFSDWDKLGLSLLNSENPKAWDFFDKHWG